MIRRESEVRSQKIKKICLLFPVLCSLILAGCASTTDVDTLKFSIANLQADSANQKKEIAQIKISLSDISKNVAEISKDVTSIKEYSINAMRESQSSLMAQTSDLSREVQTLKGRFDENKHFADRTMKDLLAEKELQNAKIASLENEIKDIKTKFSALQETKKEAAVEQRNKKEPIPEPTQQKADTVDDPYKLYDDAQIDFHEKRLVEARLKFEKITKDFPKHNLASNSHFWIGEVYYAEKRFEDAILSYETLLKNYPEHEKAKAAMLKQAYAFIEMGDKKTGKVILERLMEKYPNSNEAKLAEKKLAEILSKKNAPSGTKTKQKRK
ncbi:MAG: tol-pal system protein YbgF [Thermodesulfovibrionales bacterium]|nr:tol-pal system protein YbgF [Thermodesulfovibrionales bacterium]